MVDIKKEGPRWGLIALIFSFIGFGGNEILTQDELDLSYYCPLTDDVGVFHRLSNSNKTGYYMVGDLEQGSACRVGRTWELWISLIDYASQQGIGVDELLGLIEENKTREPISYDTSGVQAQYNCDPLPIGCVVI